MRLEKDVFESWAKLITPADETFSLSKVALAAQISKSSLFFQARRGYIEASVVIAYSRARGRSPLTELLTFAQFAIYAGTAAPSETEILTQLPPESYMEEILRRIKGSTTVTDPGPMPGPYAMKRWVDSYDLWGQYDKLAEHIGVSSRDRLSDKINKNKFTLGELTRLIEYADLTPRFGLAVAGALTLEEVGYSFDLREKVLAETETTALIAILGDSLRWLSRSVQARELENDFYRNLS